MGLREAIEQPRFASFSYPRSSAPHPYSPGLLSLESRIDSGVGEQLAGLGHDVSWWPDWDWAAGAVCAIIHDTDKGTYEGSADPRRTGAAAGW
ncbi:MAG: gamma-glutamyltranspeptidase/glutathione hydrolase [Gammaproteobacteria bacterium]|jgi:gamma-glutamyltranspeptidase/glutathione hydrolase